MIQKAAINHGHEASIYTNDEVISFLNETPSLLAEQITKLPHYVVFTDKDIYLAKQLELLGIPVFNSADTIEISDDKIKTYQYLAKRNIAIPKTIIAPKTFGCHLDTEKKFLKQVREQLAFPFIIKEAFGSFGEQVYLIQNELEMKKQLKAITDQPFMFQEFIQTSYGKDVRIQVVGSEVITAMLRTSNGDFRANVTTGGKMQTYEPSKQEKKIAIQATKAIGADFAGVDLLFGKDETPIVCEVNSNAHIRNLLECTGINVADFIISYIEKRLKEGII